MFKLIGIILASIIIALGGITICALIFECFLKLLEIIEKNWRRNGVWINEKAGRRKTWSSGLL